ncbi:4494_t:CDS:2 [Funneliformis geosporum]|uniref:18823_t:CDS:1 n=1 Tax=Funneliformis geosporum TaxID=1117311 RepID=A0A9W4SGY3_9GLOM|nr:4494_t:CDS:2 [Funneliformis geosporum]CAI2168688.1 18823_t:CDS:2 [Funneliformis geosporum]
MTPIHANSLTEKQVVISQEFPTLLSKSKEELEDLYNNDVVFDSFLETVEQVRNMKTLQDEMRMGNETLARKTLSQEQELYELRNRIVNQEKGLKELFTEFEEKLKVQQETLKRFSPSILMTKLKSETQQSDELSEQMAKSFLDGELEVDQFLKHFREVRKVYHLRNAKVERVSTQPGILGTM